MNVLKLQQEKVLYKADKTKRENFLIKNFARDLVGTKDETIDELISKSER